MKYLSIFLIFSYTSMWLTFIKNPSLLGRAVMAFAAALLITLIYQAGHINNRK